jgi:hypothetical protein
MSETPIPPEVIRHAADSIVEFAILAFAPEFLRWDKTVNVGTAELVWNFHGTDIRPPAEEPDDPVFEALVERLVRARRTRWGDEEFLVLGLDAHREGDRLFFTFDLTWDEGETCQACKIEWVLGGAEPADAR